MSAWKSKNNDPRIDAIASAIRVVPDFPKPGIMFKDITTLLLDPKAFKNTVDLFVERYAGKRIDVVAGVEARGFIFGPPIALAVGAKFIPLRKPRKLPGEVISEKYVLEYGSDCLEMHVGAVKPGEHALIVDDLVATGGTLCAAINLLEPGSDPDEWLYAPSDTHVAGYLFPSPRNERGLKLWNVLVSLSFLNLRDVIS